MNYRSRSGLVLGILTSAVMLPLFAASQLVPTQEPWPTLLSQQAADVDPGYVLLQDRANAALAKMLPPDGAQKAW